MALSLFDIGGIVGVFILLTTYFLLQLGRLDSRHFIYSFLNFTGALLIFISLLFDWNLAAGLIELFWMLISIFGIVKVYRARLSDRSKH